MVLIPGIIKTYFLKKTKRGREKKGEETRGARLEQIGHRWEMQWGSRVPYHKYCRLLLFKKRELCSCYRI